MKGSPMQRNFGIGSPLHDSREEDPLTNVEKARRKAKIMRSGTSVHEYNVESGKKIDKAISTKVESAVNPSEKSKANAARARKEAKKHFKKGSITRNYPKK